jgi:hypothetical protein
MAFTDGLATVTLVAIELELGPVDFGEQRVALEKDDPDRLCNVDPLTMRVLRGLAEVLIRNDGQDERQHAEYTANHGSHTTDSRLEVNGG